MYGSGNKDTRNVIISDSTVQAQSGGEPVFLRGDTSSIVIRNSTVNLVRTSKGDHVVIALGSGSTNSIDLSKKGSVTLTAQGKAEFAMIEYPVSITPGTECTAGTYVSHWKNYKGEYDAASATTVLQFKHNGGSEGVEVSGTITSYGEASEKVTVTLTPATGGTPLTTTVTGNSAAYSFPTVPAGEYTLKVEKTGHTPFSKVITVGSNHVTENVTIYLVGDVNGDGAITADDLTALARHVAKISVITDTAALARCDVTKDGSVTADDLTMLARYVAKIISSFD